MRLAMSEISRRRADEFGDFVAVLKLGAVNLNHRSRIPYKRLRGSFDHPRLAGTCGTEKQKIPDRTTRAGHAGQKHLIDVDDLVDRLFLPDYSLAEIAVVLFSVVARKRRVQFLIQPHHIRFPPPTVSREHRSHIPGRSTLHANPEDITLKAVWRVGFPPC